MDYAQAVAALYQAPLGEFVAERKRLASELKAAGDKDGARTLAKLGRPPISAWAVNQLYWHARDAFDRLMATAAQLRDGDLAASPAHREALAQLRHRAAAMLADAGHTATEATLRRTTQTIAAIAAIGSFAPDPPGALATDRDPPGFEAASVFASGAPALSVVAAAHADDDRDAAPDDDDADADDDTGTDDPDISVEEREAAADLLRAAAAAKPARHLSAVPNRAAASPPAKPRVRSADGPVRNADHDVRLTDRGVRHPDPHAHAANDSAPAPKRARHLSAVPLPAAALDEDEARERARIAAARHAAAEQAERAERARIDEEKRRARERDRLTTVMKTARGEVETRLRAADHLRAELQRAEASVGEAVAIVDDLERALAALDE